jgi:hypothetical protein
MHSFLEFGLNPLCVAVPEAFPHHLGQWDSLLSLVQSGTLLQNHVNGLNGAPAYLLCPKITISL